MNITKIKLIIVSLLLLAINFGLVNIGLANAASSSLNYSSSNYIADASTDCSTVNASSCSIISDLVVVINFLSAGIGIIIVVMIVIGGIEYTASADNPQTVQNAKKKITNALLALVFFIFLYAFLNFIIPGGVL